MINIKLNYLTEAELEMSREKVNLQIVLGLQSCKTNADVCQLLDDVREHENYTRRKVERQHTPQDIIEKLEDISPYLPAFIIVTLITLLVIIMLVLL